MRAKLLSRLPLEYLLRKECALFAGLVACSCDVVVYRDLDDGRCKCVMIGTPNSSSAHHITRHLIVSDSSQLSRSPGQLQINHSTFVTSFHKHQAHQHQAPGRQHRPPKS
jgi:hypothetical protein